MLREQFNEAFSNVQATVSNHQKYVQIFTNLYAQTDFEDFFIEFMRCIDCTLREEIANKENVTRTLTFAANFCGKLVKQYEMQLELENEDLEDAQTEPFLSRIIEEALMYHDLDYVNVRYHTCQFISLIFQYMGDEIHLSNELCESLQDAMLERIVDIKPCIRAEAITALLRLQNPTNIDCPIIEAFILCMVDKSSLVRKEAVRKIAVCLVAIPKIIVRLRDTDHNVRLAAYLKCSAFSPKLCKIVERQTILLNGINEEHKSVKMVFENILLQKWLTAYEDDILKLLTALKLDADEKDIKQTSFIYTNILKVFFKTIPLQDIVETLSLNEDRIVPMDKLSVEIVTYWYNVIQITPSVGDPHDFMDNVLPDLTPLCRFIESFIREKKKQQLDDWEYLEFQRTLLLLLKVAGKCDIVEEVGRCAFRKLLLSIIVEIKLEESVLSEIVTNLLKIIPDIDVLSNELCLVITQIREHLVSVEPSKAAVKERDLKVADIRVKICRLEVDQENAINAKDFHAAAVAQEEIVASKKVMKELQNQFVSPEQVKEVQTDSQTICRCLDVLIALMQHMDVGKLPVSLRSCKDEFVMSLAGTSCMTIYWRIFKCIVLYALIDKEIAVDKLCFICTPVIVYRMMASYDKPTLLISIGAIADLIRVYGCDMFSGEEISASDNSKLRNKNGRRLYRQHDQLEAYNFDNISCEEIIDIMLDMLDDDLQEIREAATFSVMALLVKGLVVSSSLVTRVLLKWFNPLTQKTDQKIQQLIGVSISEFANTVHNSGEIFEKAIVPTLVTIGNAPKTSPLSNVDIEGVLQFLALVTKLRKDRSINTHKNLAYLLCHKIAKKPNDQCVLVLVKMLSHLDLPLDEELMVTEIIQQTELLLKVIVDKNTLRHLKKFILKLKESDITVEPNMTPNVIDGCQETPSTNESTRTRNQTGSTAVTGLSMCNGTIESSREGNNTTSDITDTRAVQNVEPNLIPNVRDGCQETAFTNKSTKRRKQNGSMKGTALSIPNGTNGPPRDGNKTTNGTTDTPAVQNVEPDLIPNVGARRQETAHASESTKRRKRRGKTSLIPVAPPEEEFSDCSLHTIVEKSHSRLHELSNDEDNELIERLSTRSSSSLNSDGLRRSTRLSGSTKVTVSETSSDSESKKKSSVGKTKKKYRKT